MRNSPLTTANYGERLYSDAVADIWWSDATRKIGRGRPSPSAEGTAARLSAAGNEYEPVQIVVRPKRALHGVSVSVSSLDGPDGAAISPENVTIATAHYLPVTKPTDDTGIVGAWPDPLIEAREPLDLAPDVNTPFWITVYVPSHASAGDYAGTVTFTATDWRAEVRLSLHVWAFSLSRETHVQSAFGFNVGNVKRYHRLDTDEELRAVVDKYYRSFAAHRISPYDPTSLDPMEVRFDKSTDPPTVTVDFTRFDKAAARYLDEFGFTTLRLPLQGVGGGTFHSQYRGTFGGLEQGTPEYEALFGAYARQIQDHLEARGWLDKVYVYWFDEPEPKQYDFVREGMRNIRRAAPKLTLMLTEEPAKPLYGDVDLWCPLTANFDPETAAERKAAGDRIWWYICTGPKAPYATLFIDHPATELRVWLWQTWKYDVDGILVWQSNYWTSDLAFPDLPQNPYADPMSYQTGYGRPVGHVGYWGNGDGRFLYPPPESVGTSPRKSLDGPTSSIRWEMLREGIEDYEYLWTLRTMAEALRNHAPKDDTLRRALEDADEALVVPDAIARSMTQFAREPTPIYEHRERVARTIERLAELGTRDGIPLPTP